MSDERRCGTCGALVALDAEWCGLCFASLREPEAEPEPEAAPEPEPEAAPEPEPEPEPEPRPPSPTRTTEAPGGEERRAPYWPCAVCGAENPLDAGSCITCGTPFVRMMRAEQDRPAVDADAVFRRSLLFPGLGHRAAGRGMDGLARGVLFAISAAMAILTGIAAKGPLTTIVFVVFVLAAIAVYAGSAIESRSLARGGGLLVSSRTLLWILVGLVFVSVSLLGLSVVTSLRK